MCTYLSMSLSESESAEDTRRVDSLGVAIALGWAGCATLKLSTDSRGTTALELSLPERGGRDLVKLLSVACDMEGENPRVQI